MLGRWLVLPVLWLLLVLPLAAQDVPPALRDWQGWVLHDVPQHDCPFLASRLPGSDSRQCAWPGQLSLQADAGGGRFTLAVHVDAPSWVALPGDARHWPQQVSANRQPAAVLLHDAQPMLRLAPGEYQVSGTLPWSARPSQLRVPEAIALVALSVDGAAVTHIERDGEQLTLGEAAAAQQAADSFSMRVYRKLQDGLPAMLETRLQFNVTGSAREQVLGPALPAGFVATALSGDLPARLDGDGRLRVQLRPGQWTVALIARAADTLHQVSVKLPPAPWPRREIWSYADDSGLRNTRVQGQATDPAQAGVPDDWSTLPAYVLDDATGLSIGQESRGDEGVRGDRLHLQRQLWLDFDGTGLSVADHLAGALRHHQRLDVAAPWQLQRAAQGATPLLVTRSAKGLQGVELREQQLDLDAGLRLPAHGGAIPTAGWQLPLESIDATLHLPHGYRLLGAPGADRSPDSWVAQWSLLDLFVVALIALLAGRLLGWPWALLAGAFLLLAQHEAGAPCWTLAATLALALLWRALPEGRLRAAARSGAIVTLALAMLWALPFAADELKYVLHPQLESTARAGAVQIKFTEPPQGGMQQYAPSAAAPAPPPPPADLAPVDEVSSSAPAARVAYGSASSSEVNQARQMKSMDAGGSAISMAQAVGADQDSRALIQAGAGTPQWDAGNDYRLGWSGPVSAQQTTRLVIAPAWLVRLLRLLMVALLAVLLARLARPLLTPLRARWRGGRGAGMAGAALLVLALLPHAARAQAMPSQQLLDQLRQRLTEAPTCAPDCAQVAQAMLQVNGDMLGVDMDIDAGAAVAVPLPQAGEALQLLAVSVDGHADAALARGDGQLLLRLDRGVHRISLHYRIAATDSASLGFALPPRHVSFSGTGWSADGIDDGRLLGDSVALRRVRTATDGTPATALAQSFPPYVRLTRSLGFGVDWIVQNQVERIAPQAGGFSLKLPLLPGEHPQGDNVLVKDGRISVTFNAGVDVVRWSSRLDHAVTLTLKAPALDRRAEVWEVAAAPMWHVDASGVPTSASDAGLRFQPLPGEKLQLGISQPVAIAGDSVAFDRVQASSMVGERSTETTVNLHARSTRGGEHAIALPAGAELLEARRDNEAINLAVRDGKLSLPLLPGAHDYSLRLREPQGVATRLRTPAFALNAPAANIELNLQLPQDRWVLWAWGPTDGPAVLYWSQLVVLLLVAWMLARFAPTPLRFAHWLLLGLGFSAFAWSAYALVVLWLLLLGLRARHAPSPQMPAMRFNLLQSGLALLTVVALCVLISAVPGGLLGLPDMHVEGHGSGAWNLRWFADQSAGMLPVGGVFSVSLWVYKIAMLAWALWLANALIGWLRWGFDAWSRGGYWRRREPQPLAPPPLPPQDAPGHG